VSEPGPGSLLVFVGGDPSLFDRLPALPGGFARMASFVLPPTLLLGPARPSVKPGPDAPWPIPADQLMALQHLAEVTRRTGTGVRVIDVNRPGEDRSLVERYVGPEDVLPVLVRPDGARLQGFEAFNPAGLRRFVGPGGPLAEREK